MFRDVAGVGGSANADYFACRHHNFNIVALLNTSGGVVERYDYNPYGKRFVLDTDYADDADGVSDFGLMIGHQGLMHDEESGLVYNRKRMLHTGLGRFTQRDPLGYVDGMSSYAGYHLMHGALDPTGLLTPGEFWDEWTTEDRQDWFDRFERDHGELIDSAARRHCIPRELLAAIIANEQIDYGSLEWWGEQKGFGDSVGLAQIQAGTLLRDGVLTEEELAILRRAATDASYIERYLRSQLLRDDFNIEMAARLISRYLDTACSDAKDGQISSSFLKDIAPGCDLSDFCCKEGRECNEMVNMNVPGCLIQALAAIWNNGPGALRQDDIFNRSPNMYKHAGNAGLLDDIFFHGPEGGGYHLID